MKGVEKYLAPALIALAGAVGCDEVVVIGDNMQYPGQDADLDAGTDAVATDAEVGSDASDADVDADAGPELLTRGKMVRDLVFEVMGYDGPCGQPIFPDVPATGELCRSVEILNGMELVKGDPDGHFRPNDPVNRAELSEFVSMAMGFVPFNAYCLQDAKDMDSNTLFYEYIGSLCENNYPIIGADGFVRPADPVTVPEWDGFKQAMTESQQGEANRGGVARLMAKIVQDNSSGQPCISGFVDVPDISSLCQVVKYVNDDNIMTGYKDANGNPTGFFGPADALTYSQLSKIDTYASGVPELPAPNGCSGANANQWYAVYMDSLCKEGLIDGTWGAKASQNITSRDAFKLAWDSDIWRTKNVP